MQAFKCNICAKYYDGNSGSTDRIRIGTFSYSDRGILDNVKNYDVCPDCRNGFFEWVQKRRFESMENQNQGFILPKEDFIIGGVENEKDKAVDKES